MFLTVSNIAHYLLDKNLIDSETLVDGGISILEIGRRNRNFKIFNSDGDGLFLKQIKSLEAMNITTITQEINFYRMASQYAQMATLIPKMKGFDLKRHCLSLELESGSENLTEYHSRLGHFPTHIATKLGAQLARCHALGTLINFDESLVFRVEKKIPWMWSFNKVPSSASGGVVAMFELLQQYPQYIENLQKLQQEWRFDSFIHGDMKWDNCVLSSLENGDVNLRLIDWELSDVGDASWDIGAIFQTYLCFWICSIPENVEVQVDDLHHHTSIALRTMFPALQAFWQSYIKEVNLPHDETNSYLIRCIQFASIRMVMSAFELLVYSPTMTNRAEIILHISQMILANSTKMAKEYFGFVEDLTICS